MSKYNQKDNLEFAIMDESTLIKFSGRLNEQDLSLLNQLINDRIIDDVIVRKRLRNLLSDLTIQISSDREFTYQLDYKYNTYHMYYSVEIDNDWIRFLNHFVEKFNEEDIESIKNRLRLIIRRHEPFSYKAAYSESIIFRILDI